MSRALLHTQFLQQQCRGGRRPNFQCEFLSGCIDIDGDMVPDMPFSLVIQAIEVILLDPGATHADLVSAKDLAEAVNLLDAGDPACEG